MGKAMSFPTLRAGKLFFTGNKKSAQSSAKDPAVLNILRRVVKLLRVEKFTTHSELLSHPPLRGCYLLGFAAFFPFKKGPRHGKMGGVVKAQIHYLLRRCSTCSTLWEVFRTDIPWTSEGHSGERRGSKSYVRPLNPWKKNKHSGPEVRNPKGRMSIPPLQAEKTSGRLTFRSLLELEPLIQGSYRFIWQMRLGGFFLRVVNVDFTCWEHAESVSVNKPLSFFSLIGDHRAGKRQHQPKGSNNNSNDI